MKTFEATYTDQNGNIVGKTSFKAQNLKEANKIAQLHKKNTREIQQAGRVRTDVGSREYVLKKLKKTIHDLDDLQMEYEKYKGLRQSD